MGFFPGQYISAAAQLLLRELDASGGIVRYSKFYDGEELTSESLAKAIGIESTGQYSAELAIDLAVFELEDEGLVEKEDLEEPLADGEPDYAITITKAGRAFFRQGRRHVSHGHML